VKINDQLNVVLEDLELLAEVELTTNLIIAASGSGGTLSKVEVDRLLGVDVTEGTPRWPMPSQQSRQSQRHSGRDQQPNVT
jgi:hypothetical protein